MYETNILVHAETENFKNNKHKYHRTCKIKTRNSTQIFGPPAEKNDLMTNSENLKIMYILKILSV